MIVRKVQVQLSLRPRKMPNRQSAHLCVRSRTLFHSFTVPAMYNGFDWHGCTLEVREDRYNGLSGPFHGFRGGFGRGGFHGGFQGGYRGSLREGGYPHGPGRDFSGQDLYADYPGPDSSHGGLRMNNCGGYGNSNGGGGYVGSRYEPEPSGSQFSFHGRRQMRIS
ncbi:hypothetical protein EDD16DRAFT_1540387 [Pisolithus croceorrhizus]|nr:hypothetical protein EDD16DRAFT_1540387 [Pisolithus croceorrhizus]